MRRPKPVYPAPIEGGVARPVTAWALLACVAPGILAWAPAARAADPAPADPGIELDPGALQSEVQRLNKEKRALDVKERELQRSLREQSQRLQEQQRALEEQAQKIQNQQQSFDEQKRRLDELKVKIEDLALPPLPPGEQPIPPAAPAPAPSAAPTVPPPAPSAPAPPAPSAPPAPAPVAPPPSPAVPQPAPVPKQAPPPSKPAPQPVPPTAPEPQPAPPPVSEPQQPPAPGQLPSAPVGRAPQIEPRSPAQISDILEQRSILTPKGTLVVEPSFQYTNSSVTKVALEGFTVIPSITIGSIDIRSVNRNTYTTALGLRYGLFNRVEVEMQVPYVTRDDTTTTRPLAQPAEEDKITRINGSGIGDIEAAAHYQFARVTDDWPYLVANLRVKSRTGEDPFGIPLDPNTGLQEYLPTGSGFWAVQPSLTFSLPSDPAVFFGSVGYLWNLERRIDDAIGTIDPGDALGISFGMGMAINQDASFTLGYSHNSVTETRQDGKPLKGSERLQVGSLLVGISHRAGRRSSIALGLGIGVTQDAPNVAVSLRLPMNIILSK